MSVRYRLFLLVSGLFVVVAVCSFFIENYVTRKGLEKAQLNMRSKILELSEKHRIDLQEFLASVIAENEERVNAILLNLSSFTPQVLRFGPTTNNYLKGTWEEAADVIVQYKWLDFLQNTNQGEVTAGLIPKQKMLSPAYRIAIDEDLSWVYVDEHAEPFLGVHIPYSMIAHVQAPLAEIPETVTGEIPEAYLLFEVADMQSKAMAQPIFQSQRQTWPPIPVKWTEGYEIEVTPIVQAFRRAQKWIQNHQLQPPVLSREEIMQKMDGVEAQHREEFSPVPVEALLSAGSVETVMKKHLDEIASNYMQISMAWALIALNETGIFGRDVLDFPAPNAITLFSSNNPVGSGLYSKEILFTKRVFEDSEYFAAHPPKSLDSNLASSMAVITPPDSERVYLGNTAQFIVKTPSAERKGYLTLGVNMDILLQRLVLAVHQTAILVYENQAVIGYAETGNKLDLQATMPIEFKEILGEKMGIVSWNGKNYFYMHIQPFPTVDLHFFLFNPEEEQFALLHELEEGSKQIVNSILLDIHIAGFIALIFAIILLHNISRRITKPIIALAGAAKEIAQGHLDQIQLSLPPLKHNDEIAVLCHSFEEMVQGLKEKEKVKGVLNKVVSNEIAQEILKGNVHLGGEEKKVTVLFADIREFTNMTQNMAPQQVIDLLNGCMTKISAVVDKNGGVIDKFVGDEAMALFGAPISHEDAALKAVFSAWEMVEALKRWNQERKSQGLPDVEMGIGIHTGLMLAGNMGAENRLNYTVIGSSVNLASRLCSAAKRMEILITKATLEEPFVKQQVLFEAMPAMTFKGIDKPVEIFRVQGIKNAKRA